MEKIAQSTVKTWVKDQPSPYQLKDLTHFPDWGNLIVWDAFFNNLTSGFMVITSIAWLAGPAIFAWLLPPALTVALVLLIIDLFILVSDLGDPWRFYHSLRVLRFTSPLSVGVWGLSCYGIFLGLAVPLSWLAFFFAAPASTAFYFIAALARLFTVMALIGAIVVICYKGVVFSCSSQPGVRDARWLTPFMVSDSLLMGLSLYALLALALASPNAGAMLVFPMLTLIIARCVTFALLWQDVKSRARIIYHSENTIIAWAVFIICGILPIALACFGLIGLFIAALLCIACGVLERYWLIGLARPRHPGFITE